MLMNLSVEYDDGVEFLEMNSGLLPADKKDNLGAPGIDRFHNPSRSVLGDIRNRDRPGVLQDEKQPGDSGNTVRWSDMVRQ